MKTAVIINCQSSLRGLISQLLKLDWWEVGNGVSHSLQCDSHIDDLMVHRLQSLYTVYAAESLMPSQHI